MGNERFEYYDYNSSVWKGILPEKNDKDKEYSICSIISGELYGLLAADRQKHLYKQARQVLASSKLNSAGIYRQSQNQGIIMKK